MRTARSHLLRAAEYVFADRGGNGSYRLYELYDSPRPEGMRSQSVTTDAARNSLWRLPVKKIEERRAICMKCDVAYCEIKWLGQLQRYQKLMKRLYVCPAHKFPKDE